MATYNWATVLPYSIGSVLDQTFEDFELLVVGDGCTDESAAVVESIDDRRVRWINLPRNTGHQAGPNNEGLQQASGDIIAYLGHDDLWLPTHLEGLVTAIDRGAACAHSSVLFVNPHAYPKVTPPTGWTYARGVWLPPTSLALPRKTLEGIGGWRMPRHTGSLDPDADFLARVFDVAGPPVWVRHVTCVKLPAAFRRNVYRTRPSQEQQYWLNKIRSADDPETAMLATVDLPYELAPSVFFPVKVWRSMSFRVRKRARTAMMRNGQPERAEKRIRRARKYKGL
jgi:glycosyltransferase involved in cell wall biosynthesis